MPPVVRQAIVALAVLTGCVSCVSYLQEYVAFGKAPVHPSTVPAEVGDLVEFELRPPVPAGSRWSLQTRGRVRFADAPQASSLDWTATSRAIHLQTIVSPWDPATLGAPAARQWLTYGLRDEGESSQLDRDLPVQRAPFTTAGPVTYAATFALGGDTPTLGMADAGERVVFTYRTPADQGVPLAPKIDAMLVESGKRTILYAEVRMDFGEVARERVGYDVTLSYAKARAPGPVEVIVVGWTGHGEYWSPFTVTRYPPRG
ncbi:MAG TPA: hypothetical protein VH062_05945 [Polyangiaceae bacterium]|jgi:hypothetical protein|nr:hypothetical protein [Polyangiaceae bacterium]